MGHTPALVCHTQFSSARATGSCTPSQEGRATRELGVKLGGELKELCITNSNKNDFKFRFFSYICISYIVLVCDVGCCSLIY